GGRQPSSMLATTAATATIASKNKYRNARASRRSQRMVGSGGLWRAGRAQRQVADQDGDAAEGEMRQGGEEGRGERQVEHAIDEDAEVEIAAAGEQAEHAVEEVERSEQAEEGVRRARGGERRAGRPQRRGGMQPVGVPGALEQPEDHVVLVDEGRDVAGGDDDDE